MGSVAKGCVCACVTEEEKECVRERGLKRQKDTLITATGKKEEKKRFLVH